MEDKGNNNNNSISDHLPPGFRFHPTDEELITYYLTRKVSDVGFTSKAIADVDLNKCEPWELPGKASMGEKEWYFFNMRDRKYPTGLRTNRATEAGYWKTTGKDKEIYRAGGVLVGMKKTLVFYKGRAPRGEKSNWVMHEYRLENRHFKTAKEEWVVCRVFEKSAVAKKPQPTQSSPQSFDSPCDTNSIAQDFGDIDVPNLNVIDNTTSGLNNIPGQSNYINSDHTTSILNLHNNNNNMNMMNNINNILTREVTAGLPSLAWPSSLLTPNLAVNSILLKALQLKTYDQQQRNVTNSSDFTFMPQLGVVSNSHNFVGSDLVSNNFQLEAPSSSKILDQHHQQEHHQQQEPPFNWSDHSIGLHR